MTDTLLFLQNLGLALLLGSLIGLERERSRQGLELHEFGGIRTMALVTMLGYTAYALFGDTPLFTIVSAAFFLLLIASYVMSSYLDKTTGATTEMAGFFAYFIGILMAMGESLIATAITLLVVLLLYFKKSLHRFAHKIEKTELYDTIKFIAIVFVVLPLLPNETMGPLHVLNPYNIWLMVVLVSSISFSSYVAIKWVGPKDGIGIGGFLGGLISSTAVAMSLSVLSKKTKKIAMPYVFGILIASSAMFFRVIVTVSILNAELLDYLLLPLGLMGVLGLGFSIWYWFQQSHEEQAKDFDQDDLELKSPFQLWPALKFGLFFAALLFITKFASDYFGDRGVYLTAFFSGIVDVDAITISMIDLSKTGQIGSLTASLGVLVAAMTNTLSKGLIVYFFASPQVGKKTFLSLLGIVVGGALFIALAFQFLWF